MPHSGIFVDFAEQILSVNQMKPATEQSSEWQTEALEVLLLGVDHVADHISLDAIRLTTEALSDSIFSARASDNMVILVVT